MKIKDLKKHREEVKKFYSDCCNSTFVGKSNGLYTYYVCNKCYNKTNAINGKGKQLGAYGLIEKIKK
jgi:hypothetical protein